MISLIMFVPRLGTMLTYQRVQWWEIQVLLVGGVPYLLLIKFFTTIFHYTGAAIRLIWQYIISYNPVKFRFQGIALPKDVHLNHFAFSVLENRAARLNMAGLQTTKTARPV